LELQDKLENASNHYEERIQHLKTKAEENDRLKKDIDTLHVGSQEAKSLVLEQKQILIRERNKCKQIEMDKQDLEDRCKYEVHCLKEETARLSAELQAHSNHSQVLSLQLASLKLVQGVLRDTAESVWQENYQLLEVKAASVNSQLENEQATCRLLSEDLRTAREDYTELHKRFLSCQKEKGELEKSFRQLQDKRKVDQEWIKNINALHLGNTSGDHIGTDVSLSRDHNLEQIKKTVEEINDRLQPTECERRPQEPANLLHKLRKYLTAFLLAIVFPPRATVVHKLTVRGTSQGTVKIFETSELNRDWIQEVSLPLSVREFLEDLLDLRSESQSFCYGSLPFVTFTGGKIRMNCLLLAYTPLMPNGNGILSPKVIVALAHTELTQEMAYSFHKKSTKGLFLRPKWFPRDDNLDIAKKYVDHITDDRKEMSQDLYEILTAIREHLEVQMAHSIKKEAGNGLLFMQ
jgi:hypothetical protein